MTPGRKVCETFAVAQCIIAVDAAREQLDHPLLLGGVDLLARPTGVNVSTRRGSPPGGDDQPAGPSLRVAFNGLALAI